MQKIYALLKGNSSGGGLFIPCKDRLPVGLLNQQII